MSKFWFDLPYSLGMAVLIAVMATTVQLWFSRRQSKRESKKLQVRVQRGITNFLRKEFPQLLIVEESKVEKNIIKVIAQHRGGDSLGTRDILRIEINLEEEHPVFVRYYPSQAGGWFGASEADTSFL